KGLAWYEITVGGDPSHASRPDQGDNAILNAGYVVDALESYDERIRAREDDLVGRAYATVTMFEAGTKENVLPEEAVITVDRRFLPEEDIEEIDAEIDGVLTGVEAAHGVEATWERTRTYEAAEIPADSDLAEVFRDHAQDVAGVTRQPFGTTGSTDVRNFVNDAGMEAITWGPGDTSQAHTYDEHVDLEAVADGREILERAAREILSGQ
ncbi:MAG: M20 family metallopeptidase, partial [Haloarculaceae archaeon]